MNLLFSIIIGLILSGCVSAATVVNDIPSLKEKVAMNEPIDFDFDVNHVVRVGAVQRQINWANAAAANGGQINILQGPHILLPASKITATLTPAMKGTGSAPSVQIMGMNTFQARFQGAGARCHIIGAQLGGAGNVQANLFPCFQNNFNTPVMKSYEDSVATELGKGNTVSYSVELVFGANFYPDSVKMEATVVGGAKLFHVQIDNTVAAPVTNLP